MNPFNLYKSNTKREQLAVPERGKSTNAPSNPHPKPVQPSNPIPQIAAPKSEPTPVVAPFPAPAQPTPKPETKKTSKQATTDELAKQREYFGFDDIPTDEDSDMSGVRFRDIFKAWGKQSVKDSELEKKLKNGKTRLGRLKKISNDVKWALQADLDEPVEPHVEPPKKKKKQTQPPIAPIVSTRPQFPASAPAGADKTIDINISFGNLPKISRPKLPSKTAIKTQARKFLANKKAVTLTSVIIIAGAGAAIYLNTTQGSRSGQTSSDTPTYTTITPADKTAGTVTWKRVSPPKSDPVFAYADKVANVAIIVSQQPVPDGFKDDVDGKTAELAKGFGATTKIDAGDVKVYVGTSSDGPQSAIFVKNNLLVLIKSQSKIGNEDWANYIKALD